MVNNLPPVPGSNNDPMNAREISEMSARRKWETDAYAQQNVAAAYSNALTNITKTVANSLKGFLNPGTIGGVAALMTKSPMVGVATKGALEMTGAAARGIGSAFSSNKEKDIEVKERKASWSKLWSYMDEIIMYDKAVLKESELIRLQEERNELVRLEEYRERSNKENERLDLLETIIGNSQVVKDDKNSQGMFGAVLSALLAKTGISKMVSLLASGFAKIFGKTGIIASGLSLLGKGFLKMLNPAVVLGTVYTGLKKGLDNMSLEYEKGGSWNTILERGIEGFLGGAVETLTLGLVPSEKTESFLRKSVDKFAVKLIETTESLWSFLNKDLWTATKEAASKFGQTVVDWFKKESRSWYEIFERFKKEKEEYDPSALDPYRRKNQPQRDISLDPYRRSNQRKETFNAELIPADIQRKMNESVSNDNSDFFKNLENKAQAQYASYISAQSKNEALKQASASQSSQVIQTIAPQTTTVVSQAGPTLVAPRAIRNEEVSLASSIRY